MDIRNISVLAYCLPDLGRYLFQLPHNGCCCWLATDTERPNVAGEALPAAGEDDKAAGDGRRGGGDEADAAAIE